MEAGEQEEAALEIVRVLRPCGVHLGALEVGQLLEMNAGRRRLVQHQQRRPCAHEARDVGLVPRGPGPTVGQHQRVVERPRGLLHVLLPLADRQGVRLQQRLRRAVRHVGQQLLRLADVGLDVPEPVPAAALGGVVVAVAVAVREVVVVPPEHVAVQVQVHPDHRDGASLAPRVARTSSGASAQVQLVDGLPQLVAVPIVQPLCVMKPRIELSGPRALRQLNHLSAFLEAPAPAQELDQPCQGVAVGGVLLQQRLEAVNLRIVFVLGLHQVLHLLQPLFLRIDVFEGVLIERVLGPLKHCTGQLSV
mmetsp:Transcript_66993/g.112367  ORF Transcript_66993/g.112367 Transcript_66993/m.112367 type:complete len:306 (-) Transcript_66993:19-936(-)